MCSRGAYCVFLVLRRRACYDWCSREKLVMFYTREELIVFIFCAQEKSWLCFVLKRRAGYVLCSREELISVLSFVLKRRADSVLSFVLKR